MPAPSRAEQLKQQVAKPSEDRKTIAGMLTDPKVQRQFALALPKHMTPERFSRIVLTEVRKNPMLMQCQPVSLMQSIIQSAQLGLEIGNGLGHAYIVPFKDNKKNIMDVQFIPGYRGYLELAWRSGKVKSIHADVVYEADDFDFGLGLNHHLQHKPDIFTEDRGKLVAAYCVLKTVDGGEIFKVIGRAEAMKAKGHSKGSSSEYSPWNKHEAAMWLKTAVRALFKFMPVSVELQRAVSLDDATEVEGLRQQDVVETGFEGYVESGAVTETLEAPGVEFYEDRQLAARSA